MYHVKNKDQRDIYVLLKTRNLKFPVQNRELLYQKFEISSCHLLLPLRISDFNPNNDIIEINVVQHLINSCSKEQIKIRRKKNGEKYNR